MQLPVRSPWRAAVWGLAAWQFLTRAAMLLAATPVLVAQGDVAAFVYGPVGGFFLFVGVQAARSAAAAVRG
jgi:hypothetical protein